MKNNTKLEWIKFDLHHHTWEDKNRKEENFNVEKILEEFNKNHVKLISITNHNIISEESIKEYKKIIKEKDYDIKMLPGIELEFTMSSSSKSNKKKQKGHLNLIFSDKEDIENLYNFFKEKSKNYDPNSKKEFKKYFSKVIFNLKNKTKNPFIIMPCFAKANNRINPETVDDPKGFKQWFMSFDILEGNISNIKMLKMIEKSWKIAGLDPKAKAAYMGTDAQTTKECLKNLKNKVSFVLTEPSFLGLMKMIKFPETRISLKSKKKPSLLKKYIENIQIDKNIKIDLSVGLNTIIGRRGSGKSHLLKSIHHKIVENKELKNPLNIKLNGNYDKKKILFLKQNKLIDLIAKFDKYWNYEKQKNFDLIKNIFGLKFDRKNFHKPIINFIDIQNKIEKNIIDLFEAIKEINEKNYKKNKSIHKMEFLIKIKNYIGNSLNEKEIILINDDINLMEELMQKNTISDWLQQKFKNIKKELELIKKDSKFKHKASLKNIYKIIEEKIKNIESDFNEEITYRNKEIFKSHLKKLNKEIIISYKKFYNFQNQIITFYNKIKNEKAFIYNEVSEEEETINLSNQIKRFKNKDWNQKQVINKFIDLNIEEDKENKKNYKNNFKSKTQHFIDRNKNPIQDLIYCEAMIKINGENITNESVGTRQEKLIEAILKIQENDIIILDQPDDNLDALTIQNILIKRIIENFKDKQWIIATHDPKIIINSDSRKIIMSNYKKQYEKEKPFYYEIDENEIKNKIYKILDGKKIYPWNRWKIYEGMK